MKLSKDLFEKHANNEAYIKHEKYFKQIGSFFEIDIKIIGEEIWEIHKRYEDYSRMNDHYRKEKNLKTEKYISVDTINFLNLIRAISEENIKEYNHLIDMNQKDLEIINEKDKNQSQKIKDLNQNIEDINKNNKTLVSKIVGFLNKNKIKSSILEIENDIKNNNELKKSHIKKINDLNRYIEDIQYDPISLLTDDLNTFKQKFTNKNKIDYFLNILAVRELIVYQNKFGNEISKKIDFLRNNVVQYLIDFKVDRNKTQIENRAIMANSLKDIGSNIHLDNSPFLKYLNENKNERVLPLIIETNENITNNQNMDIKIRANPDFVLIKTFYDNSSVDNTNFINPVVYFFEDNKFDNIVVNFVNNSRKKSVIKYTEPVEEIDDLHNSKSSRKKIKRYYDDSYYEEYKESEEYDEYDNNDKNKKEPNTFLITIPKTGFGRLEKDLNNVNNLLAKIMDDEYSDVATPNRKAYSIKNVCREYSLLKMFFRENLIRASLVDKKEVHRAKKKI